MSASVSLSVGLGLLLVMGAILKVLDRRPFEAALVALMPHELWRRIDSGQLARALVGLELVVGGLLIGPLRNVPVVEATTVVLFASFFAATLRARSLRVGCGCLGAAATETAASAADVVRSVLLLLCALSAVALSQVAVETTTAVSVLMVTIPLGIGLAPIGIRALSAWLTSGDPTGPAQRGKVSEVASTRRGFLGQAGRLAALVLGLLALGDGTALAGGGGLSCEAAFDLCYGCTTKELGKSDITCCIGCYGNCQMLLPCPSGSCGGCWP